ncbi:hypothetical protein C7E12_22430, partial [Stenotrophomonas maltophilia]
SADVALAIDEAYQPRFGGDDIALSPLGKVLAIAERVDTLAGGFNRPTWRWPSTRPTSHVSVVMTSRCRRWARCWPS